MVRLPVVLLLGALVLPYARAPLCQADTHVHHGMGDHAAFVAETAEDGEGVDCHHLMGCTTVLQADAEWSSEDRSLAPPFNDQLTHRWVLAVGLTSPPTPPPPKSA